MFISGPIDSNYNKNKIFVYSYEMGSGPAMIMSRQRVNDGQEHTIEVSKLGRSGTLTIDGGVEVTGESQGFLQMLNADGNLYIGKLPCSLVRQ